MMTSGFSEALESVTGVTVFPLRTLSQGPKVLQGTNSSLWEVSAELKSQGII